MHGSSSGSRRFRWQSAISMYVERLESRLVLSSTVLATPTETSPQLVARPPETVPDSLPKWNDTLVAQAFPNPPEQVADTEYQRTRDNGLQVWGGYPTFFDSQGRLYLESNRDSWTGSVRFTRLLPDGTVDASFGDGGFVLASGPLPIGMFVYHQLSEADNGNLLFTVRAYWVEDIYVLSEDGRLLSSESNNGWRLGTVRFEGASPQAAGVSTSGSTSNAASLNSSDAESGHDTVGQPSGPTLTANAVGLIDTSSNSASGLSVLLPSTSEDAPVQSLGTLPPKEPARFAPILSEEINLAVDKVWVDLSLEPMLDFATDN